MSDEGKPLQPEHVFKKVIWRGTLALGEGLDQFTTWTITGIAAIVALLVSNLDSISQIVSAGGLRGALILFTVSLLAAVTSKQIGNGGCQRPQDHKPGGASLEFGAGPTTNEPDEHRSAAARSGAR